MRDNYKQMAKQTGIIRLSGKLGNVVHYQRDGKHFTKQTAAGKHQFSAGSIAAQQSFGLGSTMGKYLKLALKPFLDAYTYEGIHNRLTEVCKQIYRAGPVRQKDSKQFIDHNINLLVGFNLNKYTTFDSLVRNNPFRLSYTASGTVTLFIAKHQPAACFFSNKKAYAVSIQFLFSIIDLETPAFTHLLAPELIIPLRQADFPQKEGKIQLPSTENKLLLCTAQVRYYANTELNQYSANRKLIAAQISHAVYIKDGMLVDYPQFTPQEPAQKTVQNQTIPIEWL